MKISRNAKNAVMLGTLCSVAYFAVYIARNILSTVTPQLIAAGFSEEDYKLHSLPSTSSSTQ